MIYVLFGIALILYTLVIWVYHGEDVFSKFRLVVFGIGVTIDSYATIVLCYGEWDRMTLYTHAILGSVSLGLMTVHFAWGVLCYVGVTTTSNFTQWSRGAWGVWCLSFVSPYFA